MKKIRKVLIAVFSVMLLVCMGLFAACDNGNSNSNDNGGTSGNEQTETTYTVTYALGDHAAAGATAPAAATATEANGYKVTLPAAPAAATGWKFSGWKVGSDVKQVGDEITVSANVTVTAQWAEDVTPAATYTVTYALGDHAAADAQVPAAATATEAGGYKVTLPAAVEAAEGWKFNGWKVGNDVKAAGSEITVSASMTVTAQWVEVTPPAEEYVNLTLTCGDNGTATLDPAPVDGKVAKGTSVKLTVTPAANYEVDSVKVNNAEVQPADGVYTFTADADTTVEVTFKVQTASVKVTCGENGTAALDPAPDTDGKVAKGTSAKLTLTPASDPDQYIVNTVILKSGADDEGTDVTADLVGNEYTFVVTGDVELVVSFKKFEAVTTPDSPYTGTWNCVVKGESTFSSTVRVTWTSRTQSISISGSVVTATVSGKPYTATLGYTVYVEGRAIEECHTIYLVPGLNNKILALSLNGETTYFIKSGTTSSSDVTIDEAFMNADGSEGSSWYGGAASMPISFGFGKLKIDGQEAIFLAESKTDSGLVYTVYANGGLYQLIYTKADDSMVLHPYGNSTEDDTPYERETPPDPVLVPQYAGKYSNNEHTVDIDADGNFSFDGTVRKLYYDAQTRVYTFNTSQREYTVKFSTTVEVFNAAANENWTLKKIEEGTAQYTLTVNCENGTVAYSAKNAENKYWAGSSVTLSITANKHFEVEKVTVNGEDAKTTDDAGVIKVTVTINADTTVEVIFKEFKEENLLSDLYQGVYTYGTTTVTITATDVTVKDTKWSLTVKFTDAQITNTGEGQFTLVNGNRKFTFTFSNENKTLKVGDSNWAVDGNTHTLTKEES